MKKLLAVLLLLVVYPAHGQDYTVAPVTPPPLQNIYEKGGTNLNLADDGIATNINIGFDFEFYGNTWNNLNISNNGFLTFDGLNSMCCQGNQLPSFGMDNSISALWTDLISVDGKNPYYKSYILDGQNVFTVGWYNTLEFYDASRLNTFEITLYEGSNNILFNYGNISVFAHNFTIGLQGTEGQFEQIYTGIDSNQFDNTAYLFTYIPPEPEVLAPDCTVNPSDTSCIIQSITNTPTETYVAETNNTEEQPTFTEEPVSETEPTVVADTGPTVIGGEALSLEELLAIADSATADEEKEEKEKELSDSITANILEQVLATTTTETEQRKDKEVDTNTEEETITIANTTTITEENTENIETDVVETVVEMTVSETSSGETTIENTLEVSVVENNVEVSETVDTQNTQVETVIDDTENETLVAETIQTNSSELEIEQQVEINETENETPVVIVQQQVIVEETKQSESNIEDNNVSETQVVETSINTSIEIATEQTNDVLVATTVSAETDVETVEQQVSASISQSNEKTFGDEEKQDEDYGNSFVSIAGTNTVLNTVDIFRDSNNIADKEAAGVLGKTEDKSDAEKKAEEIVAANAKEQEEINNNYMDADQSGLIGAIAGDTDVTAYRSSNIPDLSSWYKPEDIYKNVKYNDNKRGMYFLEKGNTDTYKKMVEEQYK
jgi:hypothetical protein